MQPIVNRIGKIYFEENKALVYASFDLEPTHLAK